MSRFRSSLVAVLLYSAVAAAIVFSFVAQMLRGECPVP